MYALVPLYDDIGKYGCFFYTIEDIAKYENNKLYNNTIKLYLVDDNTSEQFISYGNLQLRVIRKAEAEKYLNPSFPSWLENESNFLKIINKEFLKINPITAEVIPTLNCCFRCEQCSYRKPKEDRNIWSENRQYESNDVNMDLDAMKTIIQKLSSSSVENIVFTGGGEPLFNKNTIKGIKYAKSLNMNVGLYTNGFFLDDSTIKTLYEIEPLFIRISIYGFDSASFSKYTHVPQKNFDKIISNIKKLMVLPKKKTQISLSFLVHPILFDENNDLEESLLSIFSSEEIKYFSYIRFTPAVDYFYKKQHNQEFFNCVFSKIDILSKKYSNIIAYTHRLNDLFNEKEYTKCMGNGFFAEIAPNGDMYFCCEKLMNDDYRIGNLLDNDLFDIFNSLKREDVSNIINCSKCQDCPVICKPHEINKQLNTLFNNYDESNTNELVCWRNKLKSISNPHRYFPGKLNAFES